MKAKMPFMYTQIFVRYLLAHTIEVKHLAPNQRLHELRPFSLVVVAGVQTVADTIPHRTRPRF